MYIYSGNFYWQEGPSLQIILQSAVQTQNKSPWTPQEARHPSLQSSQELVSLEVNLDGFLKNNEILRLILGTLLYDFCKENKLFSYFEKGYECFVTVLMLSFEHILSISLLSSWWRHRFLLPILSISAYLSLF